MSRYPSARRLKVHRNYTVEEIARTLGVHKHTVRRWEKAGLQSIDEGRPKLFRGPELQRFLGERRREASRPSGSGEMYCFGCRAARVPFGGIADLLPLNASIANLRGMCQCGTLMNRRVSHRTFHTAAHKLSIAIPDASSRIGEQQTPTVNVDIIEVWKRYAK